MNLIITLNKCILIMQKHNKSVDSYLNFVKNYNLRINTYKNYPIDSADYCLNAG